jgi:rRNA maturation endonuclease Nob1
MKLGADAEGATRLPRIRCDGCDNIIDDPDWNFCAWCGLQLKEDDYAILKHKGEVQE